MRIPFSKLEEVTEFKLVPDFPKSGIQFIDIMPFLSKRDGINLLMDKIFEEDLPCFGDQPDVVLAPESRGFLIGVPISQEFGCRFVPARKPGKLPPPILEQSYDLEYGQDTLCIEEGSIKPGQKVLIVDDVLATGGTAEALVSLVKKAGGIPIGIYTVIDLYKLHGDLSVPSYSTYQVY